MIDYIDSSLPKIHPAQCCDKLSPLAQDFWSFSSADFVEGAAAVKASVSLAESPFVSYEKHLRQSLRELLAARIEEAKDGCFQGAFAVQSFGIPVALPALEVQCLTFPWEPSLKFRGIFPGRCMVDPS